VGLGEGSIFMDSLKEIRKKKGLTAVHIGNQLGLSKSFINRVEGGNKVSYQKVRDLANFLDCDLFVIPLGNSYVTTVEKGVITYDFLNGNVIVNDTVNKSLYRTENSVIRELYDYDKEIVTINELLNNFLEHESSKKI
jgi:transcriptional regulator with XRE-family HTH domain